MSSFFNDQDPSEDTIHFMEIGDGTLISTRAIVHYSEPSAEEQAPSKTNTGVNPYPSTSEEIPPEKLPSPSKSEPMETNNINTVNPTGEDVTDSSALNPPAPVPSRTETGQRLLDKIAQTQGEAVENMPLSIAGALDSVKPVPSPSETLGEHLRGVPVPVDVVSWLNNSQKACQEGASGDQDMHIDPDPPDHGESSFNPATHPNGSSITNNYEEEDADADADANKPAEVANSDVDQSDIKTTDIGAVNGDVSVSGKTDASARHKIMIKGAPDQTPPPPNPAMKSWLKLALGGKSVFDVLPTLARVSGVTRNVEEEEEKENVDSSNTTKRPENKGPKKVEDAISYVNLIKSTYKHDPATFNRFLCLLRDFKFQRISLDNIMRDIKYLFRDHIYLVKGFDQFLPASKRQNKPEIKLEKQPYKPADMFCQLFFGHKSQVLPLLEPRLPATLDYSYPEVENSYEIRAQKEWEQDNSLDDTLSFTDEGESFSSDSEPEVYFPIVKRGRGRSRVRTDDGSPPRRGRGRPRGSRGRVALVGAGTAKNWNSHSPIKKSSSKKRAIMLVTRGMRKRGRPPLARSAGRFFGHRNKRTAVVSSDSDNEDRLSNGSSSSDTIVNNGSDSDTIPNPRTPAEMPISTTPAEVDSDSTQSLKVVDSSSEEHPESSPLTVVKITQKGADDNVNDQKKPLSSDFLEAPDKTKSVTVVGPSSGEPFENPRLEDIKLTHEDAGGDDHEKEFTEDQQIPFTTLDNSQTGNDWSDFYKGPDTIDTGQYNETNERESKVENQDPKDSELAQLDSKSKDGNNSQRDLPNISEMSLSVSQADPQPSDTLLISGENQSFLGKPDQTGGAMEKVTKKPAAKPQSDQARTETSERNRSEKERSEKTAEGNVNVPQLKGEDSQKRRSKSSSKHRAKRTESKNTAKTEKSHKPTTIRSKSKHRKSSVVFSGSPKKDREKHVTLKHGTSSGQRRKRPSKTKTEKAAESVEVTVPDQYREFSLDEICEKIAEDAASNTYEWGSLTEKKKHKKKKKKKARDHVVITEDVPLSYPYMLNADELEQPSRNLVTVDQVILEEINVQMLEKSLSDKSGSSPLYEHEGVVKGIDDITTSEGSESFLSSSSPVRGCSKLEEKREKDIPELPEIEVIVIDDSDESHEDIGGTVLLDTNTDDKGPETVKEAQKGPGTVEEAHNSSISEPSFDEEILAHDPNDSDWFPSQQDLMLFKDNEWNKEATSNTRKKRVERKKLSVITAVSAPSRTSTPVKSSATAAGPPTSFTTTPISSPATYPRRLLKTSPRVLLRRLATEVTERAQIEPWNLTQPVNFEGSVVRIPDVCNAVSEQELTNPKQTPSEQDEDSFSPPETPSPYSTSPHPVCEPISQLSPSSQSPPLCHRSPPCVSRLSPHPVLLSRVAPQIPPRPQSPPLCQSSPQRVSPLPHPVMLSRIAPQLPPPAPSPPLAHSSPLRVSRLSTRTVPHSTPNSSAQSLHSYIVQPTNAQPSPLSLGASQSRLLSQCIPQTSVPTSPPPLAQSLSLTIAQPLPQPSYPSLSEAITQPLPLLVSQPQPQPESQSLPHTSCQPFSVSSSSSTQLISSSLSSLPPSLSAVVPSVSELLESSEDKDEIHIEVMYKVTEQDGSGNSGEDSACETLTDIEEQEEEYEIDEDTGQLILQRRTIKKHTHNDEDHPAEVVYQVGQDTHSPGDTKPQTVPSHSTPGPEEEFVKETVTQCQPYLSGAAVGGGGGELEVGEGGGEGIVSCSSYNTQTGTGEDTLQELDDTECTDGGFNSLPFVPPSQ